MTKDEKRMLASDVASQLVDRLHKKFHFSDGTDGSYWFPKSYHGDTDNIDEDSIMLFLSNQKSRDNVLFELTLRIKSVNGINEQK